MTKHNKIILTSCFAKKILLGQAENIHNITQSQLVSFICSSDDATEILTSHSIILTKKEANFLVFKIDDEFDAKDVLEASISVVRLFDLNKRSKKHLVFLIKRSWLAILVLTCGVKLRKASRDYLVNKVIESQDAREMSFLLNKAKNLTQANQEDLLSGINKHSYGQNI